VPQFAWPRRRPGTKPQQTALVRLWKREDGADLIEYALLLGLIAVISVGAVATLGQDISSIFSSLEAWLEDVSDGGGSGSGGSGSGGNGKGKKDGKKAGMLKRSEGSIVAHAGIVRRKGVRV